MKKFILLILSLISLGLLSSCHNTPGPVGPEGEKGDPAYKEVVITTYKDTYLYLEQENNKTPQGKKKYLTLGCDPEKPSISRTLLAFDLERDKFSDINKKVIVIQAILSLYIREFSPNQDNFATYEVYPIIGGWREESSYWEHDPLYDPKDLYAPEYLLANFTLRMNNYHRVDIYLDTGYISNKFDNNSYYGSCIGILIKDKLEQGDLEQQDLTSSYVSVYSREYEEDNTKQPTLRIIYKEE